MLFRLPESLTPWSVICISCALHYSDGNNKIPLHLGQPVVPMTQKFSTFFTADFHFVLLLLSYLETCTYLSQDGYSQPQKITFPLADQSVNMPFSLSWSVASHMVREFEWMKTNAKINNIFLMCAWRLESTSAGLHPCEASIQKQCEGCEDTAWGRY
jgi:hypothetical protein